MIALRRAPAAPRISPPSRGRWVMRLVAIGPSVAVTLPLWRPGFTLAYDMVFVPTHHFSADMLGLSRGLPRAVPTEILAALASRALSGQFVQKLVLAGILATAAWGAARLVPSHRPAARAAAGMLYAWNPLVYERLLLGHWVLLGGYAALPWVAAAALAARRGEPRALARLALCLAAAAAFGPYGGIFAGAVALAVAVAPPVREPGSARRAGLIAAAGTAANLPWLVPLLLHRPVPNGGVLGTALFRARSDSPLGIGGSLASLGGLWRTDLAPPGRTTWAWVPAFVLIGGISVLGWRTLKERWPAGAWAGLLGVAGIGFVLAVGPSVPGIHVALSLLARHAPGGGFLRDSQKFVLPLALAESVGYGMGVERALWRGGRSSARAREPAPGAGPSRADPWSRVIALAAPLLPVALAPTLAWGAAGRLSPATYPSSWERADRIMAADPVPGAALALPWHAYLPLGWNHGRTVHQPAGPYFARTIVASTALEVGGRTLPDEDPWSRLARPVASRASPLASRLSTLGVRYVLLFREADWRRWLPAVAGLAPVLRAADLTLYRARPPASVPVFDTPPVAPVAAGDGVAVLAVAWSIIAVTRGRRASREGQP